MKQLASLYIQAILVFVTVHVTPAVIAGLLSFKMEVYMACITSPMYNAMMFFISLMFTMAAVEHIKEA